MVPPPVRRASAHSQGGVSRGFSSGHSGWFGQRFAVMVVTSSLRKGTRLPVIRCDLPPSALNGHCMSCKILAPSTAPHCTGFAVAPGQGTSLRSPGLRCLNGLSKLGPSYLRSDSTAHGRAGAPCPQLSLFHDTLAAFEPCQLSQMQAFQATPSIFLHALYRMSCRSFKQCLQQASVLSTAQTEHRKYPFVFN